MQGKLKKFAGIVLILIGLTILYISTSSAVLHKLFDLRDSDKWWGDYQCKNGDLISMSYLDFVNVFRAATPNDLRKPESGKAPNTALYLFGDSHTWKLADTLFAAQEFHFIHRSNGGLYHLDTTKRNVLIIEISERDSREYFHSSRMLNDFREAPVQPKATILYNAPESNVSQIKYAGIMPPISLDDFFNKNINQAIQFNVFDYNFIIPMFEYKAALNYYLFNRASGDAVISNDRKYLLLRQTITKTDATSSYSPLQPNESEHIVDTLNKIYDYYKSVGFNEVYLSVVPNPVTILQPVGYNNLIPLVQTNTHLKMKVIDLYAVFKHSDQDLYWHGDTHWNYTGIKIWLDMVNRLLTNKTK